MPELALTFNGTAVTVDDTNYTRELFSAPIFSGHSGEAGEMEYPGFGRTLSGAIIPAPLEWSFQVKMKSKDSNVTTGMRRQLDLANDLAKLCNPELGDVKALFTRYNAAGSTVSRYLWTQVRSAPVWAYGPQGGVDGVRAAAYSTYTVPCLSRFPWFVDNTASFDQQISNLGVPYAVSNPGHRWAGFRLELKSGTTYTGQTMTITDASDSTNNISLYFTSAMSGLVGAVLEWWYPAASFGDPIGVRSYKLQGSTYQRGRIIPGAGKWLNLAPGGSTSLNFAVSGGSGSVVFQFTVVPVYFSL